MDVHRGGHIRVYIPLHLCALPLTAIFSSCFLAAYYFFPSPFCFLLYFPSHSLFRFMSPCSFSQMSSPHFGCSSTFYYQGAAAHSKWPYLEAIEGDICVIREELEQAQCAVCLCRRRNREQPQNRNISRCVGSSRGGAYIYRSRGTIATR
jgi:hypothetical protein